MVISRIMVLHIITAGHLLVQLKCCTHSRVMKLFVRLINRVLNQLQLVKYGIVKYGRKIRWFYFLIFLTSSYRTKVEKIKKNQSLSDFMDGWISLPAQHAWALFFFPAHQKANYFLAQVGADYGPEYLQVRSVDQKHYTGNSLSHE